MTDACLKRDPSGGYLCNLDPGHDGPHVATTRVHEFCAAWNDDPTPEPTPAPKEPTVTTLDLDSIPHPSDCHRVPVGATIPAGTPYWCVLDDGGVRWIASGNNRDEEAFRNPAILTAEPILAPIPAPTPEDSPIIASGKTSGNAKFTDLLCFWSVGYLQWRGLDERGGHWNINPEDITSWSPAVVTPTGHGVMNDRDKRDRIDRYGFRWMWQEGPQSWSRNDVYNEYDYGTLAALNESLGPLTFADQEADR